MPVLLAGLVPACCPVPVGDAEVDGVWLVTGGVACCGVVVPGFCSCVPASGALCCCSIAIICGGSEVVADPLGLSPLSLSMAAPDPAVLQVGDTSRTSETWTLLVDFAVAWSPWLLLSLV